MFFKVIVFCFALFSSYASDQRVNKISEQQYTAQQHLGDLKELCNISQYEKPSTPKELESNRRLNRLNQFLAEKYEKNSREDFLKKAFPCFIAITFKDDLALAVMQPQSPANIDLFYDKIKEIAHKRNDALLIMKEQQ